MPAQYEQTLLPSDTLKVNRLNDQEREYIVANMGKSRRDVVNDPPAPPANVGACAYVLDRVRDEPVELQNLVSQQITKSLEFEKVMDERREKFGYVDLSNIGVGTGDGQRTELDIFDVQLSERTAPVDGTDWASDFRSEGSGPVVADPRKLREARTVNCPWCETVTTGVTCLALMTKHVKKDHKMQMSEWKSTKMKEIREGFTTLEGIVQGDAGIAKAPEGVPAGPTGVVAMKPGDV